VRNSTDPPLGGVLCLDLSLTTGFAYGMRTDRGPAFGIWKLPRIGGEGARGAYFENTLARMLYDCQPSNLVLEAPLPLPAQTHMKTCEQQLGLRQLAYVEAWRAKVPVSEISALTVRMELMGTARFRKNEVKAEVMKFIRARGWMVTDHNAADACMLWLWHMRRMTGMPPVAGPLFREVA
jgi:Holliday junction resolvasome RuvABC endonuclease subunit